MTASVFVGTSLDGFIARANGGLDWLPAGGGEPHGYDEFIASVDAIVIGCKTFETVLSFGGWAYGNKRVVVLSGRPVDLSAVRGGVVEQMAGSKWGRSTRPPIFRAFLARQMACLKRRTSGTSPFRVGRPHFIVVHSVCPTPCRSAAARSAGRWSGLLGSLL
jgi:hypothetical protein